MMDFSPARKLILAGVPAQVLDYNTKQPKSNDAGEQLWTVDVLHVGGADKDDSPEVFRFTVAGSDVPKLAEHVGTPVQVHGAQFGAWAANGKNGVRYAAKSINAVAAGNQQKQG